MGQLYFKTFSGQPDETIIIGLTFMFTLIYVAARLLLEVLYVVPRPAGALPVKRRSLLREVLASGAGKLGVAHGARAGRGGPRRGGHVPARLRPDALVGPGGLGRLPQGRAARLERGLLGRSDRPSTASSRPPSRATSTERGEARVDTYDLRLHLRRGRGAHLRLLQPRARVTFQERPPALSLVLQRPDGTEVTLLRSTVRGPRPGEEPPYVRHDETPLRVLVSAEPETAEAVADAVRRGLRRGHAGLSRSRPT